MDLNIFKPKREVSYTYSLELLQQHLEQLKETEVKIYELHDNENLSELLKVAEERKELVNNLHNEFKLLSEDEDVLSHSDTNSSALKTIVSHLKKIELLLGKQVESLDKSKVLMDTASRFEVLNGDNRDDTTKSQLTMQIEKLEKEISGMPQVIAKLIVEEMDELGQVVFEDTRPQEIRDRFEIRSETIYDRETKLEWDKDWTKLGGMDWDSAMKKYGKKKKHGKKMPTCADFKTLNVRGRESGYPIYSDLGKIGFEVDSEKYWWYWTCEEYGTGFAWLVDFGYGSDTDGAKTLSLYVVCVRRG